MSDANQQANRSERRRIYFSGRVQGVGFRFTTQMIAERFKITGLVRNLPDGRVECVVEGTVAELDRFVDAIKDRMKANIDSVHVTQAPATNEFTEFSIVH